jgi:superfamily II DNA or RNA helicase/cytochrome c5
MRFQLRDYQSIAVDFALDWFGGAGPSARLLMAAPTGTGKSVIELEIQRAADDMLGGETWIVTPRLEIVEGLLDKLGIVVPPSEAELIRWGAIHHITTPIRLRNELMKGNMRAPARLILDESHHDLAETWQQIHLLSQAPAVGFTASPYRGTPKGTAAMREIWGEPHWILTLPQAIDRGVLSLPDCRIWPLVDDDEIEVANGELVASQVTSAVMSQIEFVAGLARSNWRTEMDWARKEAWDRPTMFTVPSVECAVALHTWLNRRGMPAHVVTGETSRIGRREAFNACVQRRSALVQINVVSEGVDLPIRRLVDLAPCLSPVRWIQQLGRIARPVSAGEAAPEYICTNRNLLRHAYLLEGCLPPKIIAQAQKKFGTGKRTVSRAFGLEAIGRLKGAELPCLDGTIATCYAVSAMEGTARREYFVILHPCKEEATWATRVNVGAAGEERQYGRWQRCEAPSELCGFASIPPAPLSEKQAAWWKRSARRCGLDNTAEVTRKNFQALPVLLDIGGRVQ